MTTRATTYLIALTGAGALALSACGGGTLGGGGGSADGPVKIGLLVPQSGVYKSLGDDMKAGFEVYLEEHDNKLGGAEVEVVLADEGETADSGKAAADKLVKQDQVTVVTGVVSSAVMNGVVDLFETGKVPLVGSNASPTTLTDATYIWRTSYVNDEPGEALGKYVAENVDGEVYFLAADYQAGKDEVGGFKKTFEPAGGTVADEVYTPFRRRPTSSPSWPTPSPRGPRRSSPSTPAARPSSSSSSTTSSASRARSTTTRPASSPRVVCSRVRAPPPRAPSPR